jgi:hypothetical protein
VSCSKEKRAHKKLVGTFQITEYRYQTLEGFSYYPSTSGSLFFETHDDAPDTYSIAISYSHVQINGSRTEAGTYTLNEDASIITLTQIINGVSQTKTENNILTLTRNDLKLGYTDSAGASHFYVFKK